MRSIVLALPTLLSVALLSPAVLPGCRAEKDSPATCAATTVSLPSDSAVNALTATTDGVRWALGNSAAVWSDTGGGWTEDVGLRGGGANGPVGFAATGTTLWRLDPGAADPLLRSSGDAWGSVDLGLASDEEIMGLAALDDTTVAIVSNEGCSDCYEADIRLRVGDVSGFTVEDEGWVANWVYAVGGDGAGRALAVGSDGGWLYEDGVWTAIAPPSAHWTGVIGFDGQWALIADDGTLATGSDGAWTLAAVDSQFPVLAGTSLDDLWVLGANSDGASSLVHSDGASWVPVTLPQGSWNAVLAPAPGQVTVGGEGPSIASGDVGGLDLEWTTAHVLGQGSAWSAPDGTVFLAEEDGWLAVDDAGTWTTVGQLPGSWTGISASGCGSDRYALLETGELGTWDGASYTEDDALVAPDTMYFKVTTTDDCTVLAAGGAHDTNEVGTVVLRAQVDGIWEDLPPAPGQYANALLASSLTDLVVATSSGVYTGDGAAWTLVDPNPAGDIARTSDGRVYVALDGDVGLAELVDGALVPVDGAPPRVDHLLADGTALYAWGYEGTTDAGLSQVIRRWDGAWTVDYATGTSDSVAVALEGADTLLVLEGDEAVSVCR